MKPYDLFTLLFVPVLLACGRIINITPSPVPSLPDLVVSNVHLGMQGVPSNLSDCVPEYGPFEIRAMIKNQGQDPAYNVSVVELSTDTILTVKELGAGQDLELIFPLASSITYSVVVDPLNVIPETNEENNTFSYLSITPTPPALCTSILNTLPSLSTPIPPVGPESSVLS